MNGMRVVGALVAVVAAGAFVAGCAGSASPSPAASPSASGNGRAALEAYVNCLNQHGVSIALPTARPDRTATPRPRPSGSRSPGPFGGFGGFGALFGNDGQPPAGVSAATWAAAQQACASLRPNRTNFANNTAFTAYRNCLASHGVTLPSSGPRALATTDPKVAAAMKICAPLRPTGGFRGAPATSPTA